jgi:hypothetical protein
MTSKEQYVKEPCGKTFRIRANGKYPVHPSELHPYWARNICKPPKGKSGAKGVYLHPLSPRFYVKVYRPDTKRKMSLGGFDTLDEAAKAYDDWMVANYGAWVFLNRRGY